MRLMPGVDALMVDAMCVGRERSLGGSGVTDRASLRAWVESLERSKRQQVHEKQQEHEEHEEHEEHVVDGTAVVVVPYLRS